MTKFEKILELQKEVKKYQKEVALYEKMLLQNEITDKERKTLTLIKKYIAKVKKEIAKLKSKVTIPGTINIGTTENNEPRSVDSLLSEMFRMNLITDIHEADEIEDILNTYAGRIYLDARTLLAAVKEQMTDEEEDNNNNSGRSWMTDEFKKHVSFEFETREEVIEQAINRGINLHSKIFFTKDYPLVNLKKEILAKNKDQSFYDTLIKEKCSPQQYAFTSNDDYYFVTAGKNKEGEYEVIEEGLGKIQYMLKNNGEYVGDIPQYSINHLEGIAKTVRFTSKETHDLYDEDLYDEDLYDEDLYDEDLYDE